MGRLVGPVVNVVGAGDGYNVGSVVGPYDGDPVGIVVEPREVGFADG